MIRYLIEVEVPICKIFIIRQMALRFSFKLVKREAMRGVASKRERESIMTDDCEFVYMCCCSAFVR